MKFIGILFIVLAAAPTEGGAAGRARVDGAPVPLGGDLCFAHPVDGLNLTLSIRVHAGELEWSLEPDGAAPAKPPRGAAVREPHRALLERAVAAFACALLWSLPSRELKRATPPMRLERPEENVENWEF